MNIRNYLIDQGGKDWGELLSGWLGVLPASFTVWLVNGFGDVFAVFEDGSAHILDVGTGVMECLADSATTSRRESTRATMPTTG